jgi:hypothetical protein
VKLGTENRKQAIAAIVLGIVLLLVVAYQFIPYSSTNASTSSPTTALTEPLAKAVRPGRRGQTSAKKQKPAQDLDPTLHLQQLEAAEQIKYEGSGRNIFVAQADAPIPTPVGTGATDHTGQAKDSIYQAPAVAPAPPIPLKFFGFASHPGEPKKIFLSKGDDVFIAGEGEVVDRRYKVLRISANSVEIQDVVGSGPPQTIPLTQG